MSASLVYLATWRLRLDPPNDPIEFAARVAIARESLGERYLCHPKNRVRPVSSSPFGIKQ